jgi:hypothetical protein
MKDYYDIMKDFFTIGEDAFDNLEDAKQQIIKNKVNKLNELAIEFNKEKKILDSVIEDDFDFVDLSKEQ